jgi:acyl-CoA synthetase (AMP-forming)/AMP-acid ligase II
MLASQLAGEQRVADRALLRAMLSRHCCSNIPAKPKAHFGVPAAGAVLNTINIRLDVDTIAYIFDHCEAKVAGRQPVPAGLYASN